MQAVGQAILVGVDKLNPAHYGNSCVDLISPNQDVEDYQLIAKLVGFKNQVLAGEDATRSKFINTLRKTLKSLNEGDFLFLTFSGYGGLIANFDNKSSMPFSHTWCLQDGQILVSEVLHLLSAAQEGVNMLILADTSGTIPVLRHQPYRDISHNVRSRALSLEIAESVYLKNKDQYDAIYLGLKPEIAMNANIVWISACQINQIAYETNNNGSLTSVVKHIWNGGNFTGNLELFFEQIVLAMPTFQSPKMTCYGKAPERVVNKKALTF